MFTRQAVDFLRVTLKKKKLSASLIRKQLMNSYTVSILTGQVGVQLLRALSPFSQNINNNKSKDSDLGKGRRVPLIVCVCPKSNYGRLEMIE